MIKVDLQENGLYNDSGKIIIENNNNNLIIELNNEQEFLVQFDNLNPYILHQNNDQNNINCFNNKIFLGKHKEYNDVIIKQIYCEHFDQNNMPLNNRLFNEITLMFNFKHPGLVSLLKAYRLYNEIFLIMPHYIGGDLLSVLNNNNNNIFTENHISKLFLPIILAIKILHNNNIIHRDIKLENIFCTTNDPNNMNLILGDFGFCSVWNDYKWKNSQIGSPFYAAPELYTNKLYKGPEVDIWALGITLFLLHTKTFPFYNKNKEKHINNIVSGSYTFDKNNNLSASFLDLFKGMCEIDINKRLNIEQVLLHPWFRSNGKRNSIILTNDEISISWEDYLSSGMSKDDISIISSSRKTSSNISPLVDSGSKWGELLRMVETYSQNKILYEELISLPLNINEWETSDIIIWLNLNKLSTLQYVFALQKINGHQLLNLTFEEISNLISDYFSSDKNKELFEQLKLEINNIKLKYNETNNNESNNTKSNNVIKIHYKTDKILRFEIYDINKLTRKLLKKITNIDENSTLATLKIKKNKYIYTKIKSSKKLRKIIKKQWKKNKIPEIYII